MPNSWVSVFNRDFPFSLMQKYSSRDISELKVLHSVGSFKEGKNVILTLKDAGEVLLLTSLNS